MTATVRRTSIYTLTVPAAPSGFIAALRTLMDDRVCDQAAEALSWRAESDDAAREYATMALDVVRSVYGEPYAVLTTGLGVHTRTVAVQDAGQPSAEPDVHVQREVRRGYVFHTLYVHGQRHDGYVTAARAEHAARAHVDALTSAHDQGTAVVHHVIGEQATRLLHTMTTAGEVSWAYDPADATRTQAALIEESTGRVLLLARWADGSAMDVEEADHGEGLLLGTEARAHAGDGA